MLVGSQALRHLVARSEGIGLAVGKTQLLAVIQKLFLFVKLSPVFLRRLNNLLVLLAEFRSQARGNVFLAFFKLRHQLCFCEFTHVVVRWNKAVHVS